MVLHDRRGAQMRNIIYTFNFYEPWGFVTGTSSAAGSGGSSGERSTSVATAGYRYPDEYACSVAYAGWVPLFCPQVPIIHTLQPLLEYILLRLRRLLEDKGCSCYSTYRLLPLTQTGVAVGACGLSRRCPRAPPPLLRSSAPLLLYSSAPPYRQPRHLVLAGWVAARVCRPTMDRSHACAQPARPRGRGRRARVLQPVGRETVRSPCRVGTRARHVPTKARPTYIASTVGTGGCNRRCPGCHPMHVCVLRWHRRLQPNSNRSCPGCNPTHVTGRSRRRTVGWSMRTTWRRPLRHTGCTLPSGSGGRTASRHGASSSCTRTRRDAYYAYSTLLYCAPGSSLCW